MSDRTLVLGDVHGADRALEQVLDRSGFVNSSDRLIFLGDAVDGWPGTDRVLDILCGVRDLTYLIGNHDEWFLDWTLGRMRFGDYRLWTMQGGEATLACYGHDPTQVPDAHTALLEGARRWYEEHGRVFVHGGWDWEEHDHPREDDQEDLTWDREMWFMACRRQPNHEFYGGGVLRLTEWWEIYVGHTDTTSLRPPEEGPVRACEVWNMDQGCGWGGRLSIMDVATKKWWQSDSVPDLYPEHEGRG